MKRAFILAAALTTAAFALHGNFDWQSFGGQPGDQCNVNLVESDAGHIIVDVEVPGFWLGKTVAGGTTWDCIDLPGFYTQTRVGLPEVPSVPQMFALPFGTSASVTIEDVTYSSYNNINLVPRQTPEIDMPHNPYPFEQIDEAYDSNEFFPGNWAETVNPAVMGGINTDRLHFNPFRYNPETGELQAARSIRVRVDFVGSPNALAFSSTGFARNTGSRMLINYDLVDASASAPTDAEAAEYVFVTTAANLDAVMPLVEFYQGIGYETAVETLASGSSAGVIKAAITDHYDTGITRFALIAGDHAALPSYNYGSFLGDYYYACLSGSDFVPEIAVGRLTGDPSQIELQVSKIIDGYYQYSFTDANTTGIVPSTAVLAAHEEQYPGKYTQCCNETAAYDYDVEMTFYKVYPPEGGTAQMVSDWYNNGIGVVAYRGHGDVTVWSWSPGWNKTHIQALTNTFLPPTFTYACLCGNYGTSTECLAESFAWDDNGASGNLAATDPSYTLANHVYMKETFKALYDFGYFNVVEATNYATLEAIADQGPYGETNAKMYIWFGDPAMEIFTNDVSNPELLQIVCNPGMVNPGSQTITMTVTAGGSPVSGATVALSDGIEGIADANTFYETATTNSSGQASFTVTVPTGATTLYTGARLHNYCPVAAQIDVYPTSTDNTSAGVETFTLGIAPAANPVVGSAAVNFSTPVTGHAMVQVFDLAGRSVQTLVNGEVAAGSHSVNWSTENISSGVYFVRLTTTDGTVSTQAMVLR